MGIDLEGKLGTPDASQSGTIGALNAAITFVFSGASEGVSITGIWTGTLVFEATIDGTNWFSIRALRMSDFQIVTSTTANGYFVVPCAEYSATRMRFSAYTSGTASIYMFGADAMQLLWVAQPIASLLNATIANFPNPVDVNYGTVGTSTIRTASQIGNATGAADFNAGATGAQTLRTISNQGLPNTTANSWPIMITDGTDVANVKTNNELITSDVFETSIYSTNITVGTSAVEAKVGASPIVNRKGIEIFHNGPNKLYYGAAGVTTTTGIQIFKNTCKFISAGPSVHIYLVSDQAGQDVRVVELA